MIQCFKKYNLKFAAQCVNENEKRKKNYNARLKRNKQIKEFTPYDGKVLNHPGFNSKFIYKLCVEDFCEQKISPEIGTEEQEILFSRLHKKLNSCKIRLTNYQLIYDALPNLSKIYLKTSHIFSKYN